MKYPGSLLIVFLFFTQHLFAGPSRLFQYDRQMLDLALAGVNRIDQVIEMNHWDTFEFQRDIILPYTANKGSTSTGDKKLWGIPGAVWGFVVPIPVWGLTVLVFNLTGLADMVGSMFIFNIAYIAGGLLAVLLVYRATKSKGQALQSFLGTYLSYVAVQLFMAFLIFKEVSTIILHPPV